MDNIIEYKIFLFGKIIVKNQFIKKMPVKLSEKNVCTIGMDCKSFFLELDIEDQGKIVSKSFQIVVYDTAGEERFKSFTKTSFKETDCIMLIYDIANRDSFSFINFAIDSI